jgi:hypothetical protein
MVRWEQSTFCPLNVASRVNNLRQDTFTSTRELLGDPGRSSGMALPVGMISAQVVLRHSFF